MGVCCHARRCQPRWEQFSEVSCPRTPQWTRMQQDSNHKPFSHWTTCDTTVALVHWLTLSVMAQKSSTFFARGTFFCHCYSHMSHQDTSLTCILTTHTYPGTSTLKPVEESNLPSVKDIKTKYMRSSKKEIIHQSANNTWMQGIKYEFPWCEISLPSVSDALLLSNYKVLLCRVSSSLQSATRGVGWLLW